MILKVAINETPAIPNIFTNNVLTIQRQDKIEENDKLLHQW